VAASNSIFFGGLGNKNMLSQAASSFGCIGRGFLYVMP
jgi:hypothetical protein